MCGQQAKNISCSAKPIESKTCGHQKLFFFYVPLRLFKFKKLSCALMPDTKKGAHLPWAHWKTGITLFTYSLKVRTCTTNLLLKDSVMPINAMRVDMLGESWEMGCNAATFQNSHTTNAANVGFQLRKSNYKTKVIAKNILRLQNAPNQLSLRPSKLGGFMKCVVRNSEHFYNNNWARKPKSARQLLFGSAHGRYWTINTKITAYF